MFVQDQTLFRLQAFRFKNLKKNAISYTKKNPIKIQKASENLKSIEKQNFPKRSIKKLFDYRAIEKNP